MKEERLCSYGDNDTFPFDESPQLSDSSSDSSHSAKRSSRRQYRYTNSKPTDVIEWLAHNKPQSFEDLMDLRKTLYSRQHNFGRYYITEHGYTEKGEERFVLNGPVDAVLILSNKCRHFLLRQLCRLRRLEDWPPIVYR